MNTNPPSLRGEKEHTALPDARHLPFGIIDPDYGRVYTIARLIAWQEGYALTLHGSFTRDLDLVAVSWTDAACDPEHLVRRIEEATKLKNNGHPPSLRPFGRMTWTLIFPEFRDPRFVDLSVISPNSHPALISERDALKARVAELEAALRWLNALVEGECPRLLNEDSGGSGELALKIQELLTPRGAE